MGKLASIIVFTYNQENLIEDTLNSTLHQNYHPLELIICDDASGDGTGEICRRWLESRQGSFERVLYCRNETNLGTTRNIMSGLSLSKGSLIKLLGGDDLLAPAAIRNGIRFHLESPESVIFGNVIGFQWGGNDFLVKETEPRLHTRRLLSLPPRTQFGILSICSSIPTPGAFYPRSFFERISKGLQMTTHIPDWPRWLEATSLGIPLLYRDFDAVFYRRHVHGHKDSAYRSKCILDVLQCIDGQIKKNDILLTRLQKAGVWANRRKHEMLAEGRDFEARFFNGLLNLVRHGVRFGLYFPLAADRPQMKPDTPLKLPFELRRPSLGQER